MASPSAGSAFRFCFGEVAMTARIEKVIALSRKLVVEKVKA